MKSGRKVDPASTHQGMLSGLLLGGEIKYVVKPARKRHQHTLNPEERRPLRELITREGVRRL